MFNTKLKQEVAAIKNVVEDMMTEIAEFKENYENFLIWKSTVDEMTAEIAELKKDYGDYLEWRKMRDANAETARKQGHFFLNSKMDVNLLEQIISEINNNEDLCALFTTSDGATLSLRVHKQPNKSNTSFLNMIGKSEEE